MLLDLINLNRSEGTKTYVQSNLTVANALGLDLLKELVREVKTCGRSSGRALLLGIYRLVIALVLKLLGDVGRQGHIAYCIQNLVDGLVFFGIVIKSDNAVATVDNVGNGRLENTSEVEG